MAKFASNGDAQQMGLFPIETLHASSINVMEVDFVLETGIERESWMTPFKQYLLHGAVPERRSKRRQVIRKASRYVMEKGIVYRRGFWTPLLRCMAHDEIKRVLKEVHEGEYGDHTRDRH